MLFRSIYADNHSDTNKIPLVVVLHGCGENAKSVSELTGWNKLSDLNSFIVLYPQQKFINNPNLCFNWFLKRDIEKGQGECESIFQMISFVRKHFPIDSNKIFITGLSAGAAMSVVLAATHPELFKGAAIFAGCAYKISNNEVSAMLGKYVSKERLTKDVIEQNPDYKGLYPPLLIYQGLNDPIVNFENANHLINQWSGINNTDTIPEKIETTFMGIEDITRYEYQDSLARTTVIYYEVKKLGHRLLIKSGKEDNEGGQIGILGVDKGYHSTFETAKEFGLIKKSKT